MILELLAVSDDRRRRARDLADVQYALDVYPELSATTLSIPALRAWLRDLCGVGGERLKGLLGLVRQVPRPRRA